MGRRWEDFIRTVYYKILPLISVLVVVVGVTGSLFRPVFLRIEAAGIGEALESIFLISLITLAVLTLFACYQVALSKDIKDLLDERLPKSHGSNPKEKGEKEERIETSGAGALCGMVVGGVLGLPFGPTGVVVGGIIGAFLGNQLEYESIRLGREKKRRKQT